MTEARFSLSEGQTPLVRSRRIGPAAGLNHLYFKLESLNPTGSYKDRFAAAAITEMLQRGEKRVIASSSGNAGAALAAYCAAAGIACEIAVVQDAPEGKLKQMLAYGAQLWKIREFGIDADITTSVMNHLRLLGEAGNARLQVSAYRHSPVGMAGVESISHELAAQGAEEGRPFEHVFVPAGGGGLLLAVARGFQSVSAQTGQPGPRVHCVQPAGNDTMAGPLQSGTNVAKPIQRSATRITGLQIPNLIDGQASVEACHASGGTGHLVNDDEVEQLQSRLACEEGIFCEPAAAVALAGALQAATKGVIPREAPIVCLITGSGFKDPAAVDRMLQTRHCPLVSLDEFRQRVT